MQTIGPARPAQSASAVHLPQVLAAVHTGVELGQSAFATHWTHAPLCAHRGMVGVRAAHALAPPGAIAQGTHAPVPEQNGFVAW
jgi:hypothetical protein